MDISIREIATVFWVSAFLIFAFTKPKVRESVGPVVEAFSNRLIISFLGLLFSYVGLAVLLLAQVGLWEQSQLKTTLVWLLLIAPVTAFRVTEREPKFFGTWITDNLKIVVVLEFLSGQYTLSLWYELLLVPFVTVLSVMIAVAKDPKHRPAKRLLEWILTIIVAVIIIRDIRLAVGDLPKLTTLETLRDFATEPMLSLALMPFLYVAYIYSSYERVFDRLQFFIKDENVSKRARHQACRAFGPNIRLLDRWFNAVTMHQPTRTEDVAALITEVWNDASREKYPQPVPIAEGWCPFRAVAFLKKHGLKPNVYRRHFDDDYSASSVRTIEVEIPRFANLNYYVSGCKTVATQLELQLFVGNGSSDPDADAPYFAAAGSLLIQATGVALSKEELNALWSRGPFTVTADYFVVEHELKNRSASSESYERILRLRHTTHAEPKATFIG